jgi:uncharacterized membrane protein YfcA
MGTILMLLAMGGLAGAINAAAGGGSFLTFPALVAAGLPSVIANASSTVALYPGSLVSVWAYRREMRGIGEISLPSALAVSIGGGLLGALLLLETPPAAFDAVIPWLLLLASLAFAFGRQAGAALRRRVRIGPAHALATQFVLGIYGGYFGGAVGIMMMAVWHLLSSADLKTMNPAKTLCVAAANTTAVACFALAGAVRWPETLAVMISASVGGYAGAHAARRAPPWAIRAFVIALTFGMTAVFFARAYR